jgi:hypothetical protein
MENQKKTEPQNPLKAIACMGIFSLPIFLICVPTIALNFSPEFLLVLGVLAALTLGSNSIWYSHSQSVNMSSPEIEKLEERLGNLETIASHDELKGDLGHEELQYLRNQIDKLGTTGNNHNLKCDRVDDELQALINQINSL